GIGDRFLGHIERCRVLLHLVDANAEDVAEAYRTVRAELDAYGSGLDAKPEVVALSKIDTIYQELVDALSGALEAASGQRPLAVSAASGAGLDAVLDALIANLDPAEPEAADEDAHCSPL